MPEPTDNFICESKNLVLHISRSRTSIILIGNPLKSREQKQYRHFLPCVCHNGYGVRMVPGHFSRIDLLPVYTKNDQEWVRTTRTTREDGDVSFSHSESSGILFALDASISIKFMINYQMHVSIFIQQNH